MWLMFWKSRIGHIICSSHILNELSMSVKWDVLTMISHSGHESQIRLKLSTSHITSLGYCLVFLWTPANELLLFIESVSLKSIKTERWKVQQLTRHDKRKTWYFRSIDINQYKEKKEKGEPKDAWDNNKVFNHLYYWNSWKKKKTTKNSDEKK